MTIDDFAAVGAGFRDAYVAVGNFDGVHRGHAGMITRLRARADAARARAIALTFDPQPAAVLRPGSAPTPLTWTDRKIELLKAAGAHDVAVFQTGPWLLGLTALEFFNRVIRQQFAARGMVEGPTFGFGRDRGGDAQLLGEWCVAAGLDFEIAAPTKIDDQIVSSSLIRRLLDEGRTAEAATLLGRPHRLRGLVVRGAGRGAGLGFPTANLERIDVQVPAEGVYGARAFFNPGRAGLPAAAHIGPNATFGERDKQVEVHVIDFAGDLYDRRLEVEVLNRIRPTRTFANPAELVDQIRADVEEARLLAAQTA
jgi:riboflavin kinase/FMN adenylyltransferase